MFPEKLRELYFNIFNAIESDHFVMAVPEAIQKLVYELYGLTPEEVAIVEGNGK